MCVKTMETKGFFQLPTPALKELKTYNGHKIGIQMKWNEVTKTFMMILNLVSMVYTNIFLRFKD